MPCLALRPAVGCALYMNVQESLADKTGLMLTFITQGLDTVERNPSLLSCHHKQTLLKYPVPFKLSFNEITSFIFLYCFPDFTNQV